MSTVGSIGQVDTSLLTGVALRDRASTDVAAAPVPGGAGTDRIEVSQAAQLIQNLGQVPTSQPVDYQQVLRNVATRLDLAAALQSDPTAKATLQSVSSQFRDAAAPAKAPGSASASTAYAPQTARHHHHVVAPDAQEKPPLIPHIELPGTIQYVLAQLQEPSDSTPAISGA